MKAETLTVPAFLGFSAYALTLGHPVYATVVLAMAFVDAMSGRR